MESRINTKIENYITTFKRDIHTKVTELGLINIEETNTKIADLLEYIYEYERLNMVNEDFVKRKRVKNAIPIENRCIAKRSNGEQCTRRRKKESEYCGTHVNGTPHGIICGDCGNNITTQNIEVVAKDIQGIVYYIDKHCNVYNTEDIMSGKENPRVIAKAILNSNNHYTIPDFGLV